VAIRSSWSKNANVNAIRSRSSWIHETNWQDARAVTNVRLITRVVAACVATLLVGASSAFAETAQPVSAVIPTQVPFEVLVPAGNRMSFVGHAVGTQNYVCLLAEAGFKFALFTPQATLAADDGRQIATHYFSPDPVDGTIRATWERSRDTSIIWGRVIGTATDSEYVAQGAIAWLLLQPVAVQGGNGDAENLTATTFVQRLNTTGGLAPSTGCDSSTDVGNQAFVPYTADYVFYEKAT
jgi:hypothetical protein